MITTDLIRSMDPCYDPVTGLSSEGEKENEGYLTEGYSATLIDFLNHAKIPARDKMWVVLNEGIIDDKTLRLFAVECAKSALSLIDNPDPRSVEALNVEERFADGEASQQELDAARAASKTAAWDSNCENVWNAYVVARAAEAEDAWDAAWGASWAASKATAKDAEWQPQLRLIVEILS